VDAQQGLLDADAAADQALQAYIAALNEIGVG
jgi:hypothetical protein